jgi:glutamate synthase (NADPH/NADH) small chain
VTGPHPLPAARAELRLPDAKPPYVPGEAVAEAHRCLYCHDAPCTAACPTGIDVPGFIRKIATGNTRGAARTILSANLLGTSCARVCPVEVLCVGACVYNAWHRTPPIAIGRLQRYATESVLKGGGPALFDRAPDTGRRVACIGAGPASLACAGYLALEGARVTVYERRPLPGGLNTTGVAPYKMHAEDALEEAGWIASLGVELRTGVTVGIDVGVDRLLADYDAVFIGAGLGGDAMLGIPGEAGPGVAGAVGWIERIKLEPGVEPEGVNAAVVVGGGNTAIDAARELARLGVPSVQILYRRTEADMSGYAHEMEQARLDGVSLVERAAPQHFERAADGRLLGVRLADGRAFPCDLALVAIGQSPLDELVRRIPGVAVDPRGRVVAEPATGRTGNPKVFVGGDARSGGELVVTAAQEGKRAARAICALLGIAPREAAPLNAGHD